MIGLSFQNHGKAADIRGRVLKQNFVFCIQDAIYCGNAWVALTKLLLWPTPVFLSVYQINIGIWIEKNMDTSPPF